jgi:hypothetical protein
LLAVFVAAAEDDDQRAVFLLEEVDVVSSAFIDPHLTDAITNWLHITRIAVRETFYADEDFSLGSVITQTFELLIKLLGPFDFHL